MKSTLKNAKNKIWKNNVDEKLRLSFLKTKLQNNIIKFRIYNENFKVLTLHSRQAVSQIKNSCSRLLKNFRFDVRKYQTIDSVFCRIYEALKRSCIKHVEHTTLFSVKVEHIFLEKNSKSQIKFEIVFIHRISANTINFDDSMWFLLCAKMIEHVVACADIQTKFMLKFNKSLKHRFDDESIVVKVKIIKKIWFENLALSLATQSSASR